MAQTCASLVIKDEFSIQVRVDCARLISCIIQDAGYDLACVDPEINDDNFPSHSPKCWDCCSSISSKCIYLVGYEREISTEQVLESMASRRLFPGGVREYLSLIIAYPKVRERVAIILGSDLLNLSQPSGGFVGVVSARSSNSGNNYNMSVVSSFSPLFRWGRKAWFVAVDSPFCGCPK